MYLDNLLLTNHKTLLGYRIELRDISYHRDTAQQNHIVIYIFK